MMKSLAIMGTALALVLGGCTAVNITDTTEAETTTTTTTMVDTDALQAALDAQDDAAKARYNSRNPGETLAFFGIEPGMTVAEALPGGGWYSKILLPYLGPEGKLVGAHYPDDMWPRFGFGDEWAATRVEASNTWTTTAAEWGVENGAKLADYKLTEMPEEMAGKLDAVLFIRALHNLNRFNADAGYMDATLAETFKALKPGGIVGVVQHNAPEANSDEWANGSNGYLKKAAVIAMFESAGFELVDSSDVNANPKDVPTEEDFVWRLPPTTAGTEEGTPERAAMEAIGESNRMTLKFIKPA
jgi:predicted methyltransferase